MDTDEPGPGVGGRLRSRLARVPVAARLLAEFMRIEFIDRCMLIAAQGLLALIPVLVVLSAFLPQLSDAAVRVFATAAGVGAEGTAVIGGEVSLDQVRTQTGVIGLLITIFSASSFARAIQRMYESVWGIGHIGGVSGFRRCLTWLIGWLVTLQFVAALRTLIRGIDGGLGDAIGFGLQCVILSAIWWVTAWMLLFGRVSWASLALGAWLTGCLGVLYNRISARVMPIYVDANADQFGTLGVILAVTTWLIGFAGVMVASALVGRVVWEETSLSRVAKRLKLTR